MKRRMTLGITILTIITSSIFYSCQQKSKTEEAIDKAEIEYEKFKEDIKNLSEDDPQFYDKLEKKLIEFDEEMEDLGDELEDSSEKAGEKFNESIKAIRAETKALGEKVSDFTQNTSDDLENLGDEIKADFNSLKQDLKDNN